MSVPTTETFTDYHGNQIMKIRRLAILASTSAPELSTDIDIANMRGFLVSVWGGLWPEANIKTLPTQSTKEAVAFLKSVRKAKFDYVFFYFSGHGCWRGETQMELNSSGEELSELAIANLASRQLNILDCCRAVERQGLSGIYEERRFSVPYVLSDAQKTQLRYEFVNYIMQATPQQLTLYACYQNQCAYDFGNGGVFTNHLLSATDYMPNRYLSALEAVIKVAPDVQNEVLNKVKKMQEPSYSHSIKAANSSQQLIFAINPLWFPQ